MQNTRKTRSLKNLPRQVLNSSPYPLHLFDVASASSNNRQLRAVILELLGEDLDDEQLEF